jgi:hypothetical protein
MGYHGSDFDTDTDSDADSDHQSDSGDGVRPGKFNFLMSGRGPGEETSAEKIGIKTQKSDASDIFDYRKIDAFWATRASCNGRRVYQPLQRSGAARRTSPAVPREDQRICMKAVVMDVSVLIGNLGRLPICDDRSTMIV